MSDGDGTPAGTIVWQDLTVESAKEMSQFYESVVGWRAEACEVGGYEDYNLIPAGGTEPVAGICHARGANANLPAQWLLYVTVEDLDQSMRSTLERGGKILDGPRMMGKNRFCVISDPAGAVMGLME